MSGCLTDGGKVYMGYNIFCGCIAISGLAMEPGIRALIAGG